MPTDKNTLQDTLVISRRERAQLIQAMNEQVGKPLDSGCRRRLRVDFNSAPPVVLKMIMRTGVDKRFTCQPRNLSRWGVSVIHGRFLYPETVCLVALPTLDKDYTVHQAVVRACRHVKGTVHEVALVFSKPIELENYVELTDAQRVIAKHEAKEDEAARQRELDAIPQQDEWCQDD